MAEGWRQTLQRANDVTHLLAAGGWLGGLVGLVPLLRLAQQPQWQADAQVALRRFSTVGHVVVAVVVVSGAVNTALIVGQVPTDWTSPYQALLAAKIGLVALMLVLAVVNRYLLVPAMTGNRSTALAAMRRSCLAEIALAVVVVALVAVFGMLEPA
jgi:putative copper resistance protein D